MYPDDRYYIKMALALAGKGRGFTSPNPMVGAVVVKDGKVVGKGWHKAAGEPHAEANAIDDAGTSAQGASLYVTLEPCNHSGKTPPCTEKILEAGISRVVVAMEDPNPEVTGGGISYLKDKGIEITAGICQDEAERLNESFVKHVLTKRPFVILKCASTLDGRIATRTGDSKWVSGSESRQFVHQLRHDVDAIMVGIGTIKADNPSLTTRLDKTEGLDPIRVILDTGLSIAPDSKVLQLNSDSDTIIIIGNSVSKEKKDLVEKENVRVIALPEKNGLIDLDALMEKLGSIGITSLLIEGGGRVVHSAFSEGVVDKVLFFYAPKIFGGDDGVPICKGVGPEFINDCIAVQDIRAKKIGDDVMLEGYINR